METLPVVNSNTNFEDIAKLIGQEEPSSPARNMFFLKINRDHEDDEGNLPDSCYDVDGNLRVTSALGLAAGLFKIVPFPEVCFSLILAIVNLV